MERPLIRHQSKYVPLSREQFKARFLERFYDPAYEVARAEIDRLFEIAYDAYKEGRKAPRTRAAGPDFADPGYELSLQWLEARAAIQAAEARWRDRSGPARILVINGSTRNEHTCPGEISKTLRLAQHAKKTLEALPGFQVDFLDLSALAAEPLKVIYPCKSCVATAMPLCHWPCSCYPNNALGQTNDWMAELYPRWVAAHGVFVLTPVNWYHASSSLKLMIDRLVCADGGNPDPSSTQGKDPALAKALELKGWPYPKHLAGRAFAVMTHGDAAGPEELRRELADWLSDMGLIDSGPAAELDTYIGYYEPYATSHDALDAEPDIFVEVETAAKSLANRVRSIRSGEYRPPDAGMARPRQK
jgi:multimeric flavodoxin WrbA